LVIPPTWIQGNKGRDMADSGNYLKKHTEALVKSVGIEAACKITGKSKATLGRYYSDSPEHADRYMPIDAVAALETETGFPKAYSQALGAHCSVAIGI